MTSEQAKSDVELTISAIDGDERAFRELIDRHRERILAICLRMLKNRVEAEEAAQDSFVKMYFHLKDFDQTRVFSAWAAGIAINECRDRLRKRIRSKRIFSDLEEERIDGGHIDASEDLEMKEKLARLEKGIELLPDKLREVLVLKAYGDHSYEEIAEILRIRMGTVMSRLFRAREKLTEIMERGVE